MSHRAHGWVAGALLFAIACDAPTGPSRDFDIDRFPYVVSTYGVRHFGTSRLLVIPARFADGSAPPLTSSEIQAQLFGGSGGGPVTQSYLLASGGAFVLRGHVTSWVTTSVAQSTIFTGGTETYVKDALLAVDDEVDFGLYDNDGPDGLPNSGDDDGVVDGGVAILNSETNRYCNGGTGLGHHPFAARGRIVTADRSVDGPAIEVKGFTVMSVTGCGGSTVGAHVLAHELGHLFFGLPDIYHQLGGAGEVWETRRWVAGCWELMAAGGWGCGTGAPTLDYRFNTLGAWSRTTLGWSTPVLVNPEVDRTYELRPLGRGGTVLRVPITADHEYLLIEYREAQPGDGKIPGNGVVMFHVAETLPLFPPTQTSPYRMSVIEADDDSALFRTELQGGNRGTASDAFGMTRGTFRSGEHSRAMAVDGSPLPFQITEIVVDAAGHRARVRISP